MMVFVQSSSGQDNVSSKTKGEINLFGYLYDGGFSGAILLQPNLYGDVGFVVGEMGSFGPCAGATQLLRIGSEFGWSNDNGEFILGPKISFEYGTLLEVRGNVICYTDFEKTDWRLTPEVGLSFCGYFGVFYGYNFHLAGDELSIANHKFTLLINFVRIL